MYTSLELEGSFPVRCRHSLGSSLWKHPIRLVLIENPTCTLCLHERVCRSALVRDSASGITWSSWVRCRHSLFTCIQSDVPGHTRRAHFFTAVEHGVRADLALNHRLAVSCACCRDSSGPRRIHELNKGVRSRKAVNWSFHF